MDGIRSGEHEEMEIVSIDVSDLPEEQREGQS